MSPTPRRASTRWGPPRSKSKVGESATDDKAAERRAGSRVSAVRRRAGPDSRLSRRGLTGRCSRKQKVPPYGNAGTARAGRPRPGAVRHRSVTSKCMSWPATTATEAPSRVPGQSLCALEGESAARGFHSLGRAGLMRTAAVVWPPSKMLRGHRGATRTGTHRQAPHRTGTDQRV